MCGSFIGTALDEAIRTFQEAEKIATTKSYDYLDARNTVFDTDYDDFIAKTNALKQNIGSIIVKNYADVWETPQGIRFLIRFEKVKYFVITNPFLLISNDVNIRITAQFY